MFTPQEQNSKKTVLNEKKLKNLNSYISRIDSRNPKNLPPKVQFLHVMREEYDRNKLSEDGKKLLRSLDKLKKMMRVLPKKKDDYTLSSKYFAHLNNQMN